MIHFACPVCGKTLKAPDEGAGRKVPCPRCGQRLQIPIPAPDRNKTVLGQEVPPPPPPAEVGGADALDRLTLLGLQKDQDIFGREEPLLEAEPAPQPHAPRGARGRVHWGLVLACALPAVACGVLGIAWGVSRVWTGGAGLLGPREEPVPEAYARLARGGVPGELVRVRGRCMGTSGPEVVVAPDSYRPAPGRTFRSAEEYQGALTEAALNAPVTADCRFPPARAGDVRGLTPGLRVVVEGRCRKVGHEVLFLEDCRLIRP